MCAWIVYRSYRSPRARAVPTRALCHHDNQAFFGILQSKIAGEAIPSDVGYDAAGNETTDPGAVLDGAIRVFDRGHKGSGLSMMVELMSNCLSGAAIENKKSAGTFERCANGLLVRGLAFGEHRGGVYTPCPPVPCAHRLASVWTYRTCLDGGGVTSSNPVTSWICPFLSP